MTIPVPALPAVSAATLTTLDLLVTGAEVVTPGQLLRANLGVLDGRVAFLGRELPAARTVLDASGLSVLPGGVDLHVHFSEPGRTHWEGWACGSRAAASGGVTTVVDMPLNAIPATTDSAAFALKRQAGESQSLVDFALWGGLVENNLADLDGLWTAGAVGFKAFMLDTHDPTFPHAPDGLLLDGMRSIARLGGTLAVHAEHTALIEYRQRRLQAAGRQDPQAWLEAHDPLQEREAIRRALLYAAETGCALHVVHVSIPEGVADIVAARQAGQRVTLEVCAHHLLLSDQDFVRQGMEAKCAPPLRDRARIEALWEWVASGEVDALTSDHSPCPAPDKGGTDVWSAWGGITGVQSLLPAVLSEGLRRGLPLPLLCRLLSETPARLAGLEGRKGTLQLGADADFVLLRQNAPWTLEQRHLHSRWPHSAWVGHEFGVQLQAVYLRGQQVAVQQEPGQMQVSAQPSGRWLRRSGVLLPAVPERRP
ncbi:allantoinase AllB [Deinococcus ruber]|uniref:Allantoinase n=1 Tax=Deinococcus ruber TaxID=1848197 RepID=A0A918CBJ0_9DEIO|nr:allantoinase AllB [Deinococcus ruber]GGR14255.1 allantoinase [Deinococcus ruber]